MPGQTLVLMLTSNTLSWRWGWHFQYSLYSVIWSIFSEVAQGEVSFIPPLIPTHNQAFSILCFDNSGLLWLGLGKGVSKKIMFQFEINVLVAANSWRCPEALSKIQLEIVLRSPLKVSSGVMQYKCWNTVWNSGHWLGSLLICISTDYHHRPLSQCGHEHIM